MRASHFPTTFYDQHVTLQVALSSCRPCWKRRRPGNWFTALSAGPISHSHNIHGAASSLREQFIFRLSSNLGRIACSWWKERKRRCALLGARINVARFVEWQWSTLRAEASRPPRKNACTGCCYSLTSHPHVLEELLALAGVSLISGTM